MKVVMFGATGMVGQGVLRECLLDADVDNVLSIGRSETGQRHEKLRELVRADLFDLSAIAGDLAACDACFFCLGVSSAGMSEEAYRKVTYDITIAAARLLVETSPQMTFIYVSGAGTDSTERGRIMWARVKGATENALMKLPFKAAYMFRPGFIQSLHGATSRTRSYRILYGVFRPIVPLVVALFPNQVTTTERIGRAMLAAAKRGAPKSILDPQDINSLASSPASLASPST
jgi:uncharacterized protein YbjT (DUF2867 family)